MAGASGRRFVARYDSNGALDATFGIEGKVITSLGSVNEELAFSVHIQPDGNIRTSVESNLIPPRLESKLIDFIFDDWHWEADCWRPEQRSFEHRFRLDLDFPAVVE